MKRRVRLSDQVIRFHAKLPPEPRKAVKAALRSLQEETGDISSLEGVLAGFHRLRIGRFRAIFAYADGAIDVVFLEARGIVYEVFEAEYIRRLSGPGG